MYNAEMYSSPVSEANVEHFNWTLKLKQIAGSDKYDIVVIRSEWSTKQRS